MGRLIGTVCARLNLDNSTSHAQGGKPVTLFPHKLTARINGMQIATRLQFIRGTAMFVASRIFGRVFVALPYRRLKD